MAAVEASTSAHLVEVEQAFAIAMSPGEDCERGSLLRESPSTSQTPRLSRRGRVLGVGATVCLVGAVCTMVHESRATGPQKADTNEKTELFLGAAAVGFADALLNGASLLKDMKKDYGSLVGLANDTSLYDSLTEFEKAMAKKFKIRSKNTSWRRFLPNATQNLSTAELKELLIPQMSRHDGNVCEDDEELHGGLCYGSCKLLTHGEYPYRTSAFACCRRPPCIWEDVSFKVGQICSGYDVSGALAGLVCPHVPGSCLEDEEMHYGLCYKKCAILTQGKYLWRRDPLSCCKFKNSLACDGAGPGGPYSVADSKFDVGGGMGVPGFPGAVHPPLAVLTENSTKVAQTALTEAAKSGDKEIQIDSNNGFAVGDWVAIFGMGIRESGIVASLGSIVLMNPLENDYPPGSTVICYGSAQESEIEKAKNAAEEASATTQEPVAAKAVSPPSVSLGAAASGATVHAGAASATPAPDSLVDGAEKLVKKAEGEVKDAIHSNLKSDSIAAELDAIKVAEDAVAALKEAAESAKEEVDAEGAKSKADAAEHMKEASEEAAKVLGADAAADSSPPAEEGSAEPSAAEDSSHEDAAQEVASEEQEAAPAPPTKEQEAAPAPPTKDDAAAEDADAE